MPSVVNCVSLLLATSRDQRLKFLIKAAFLPSGDITSLGLPPRPRPPAAAPRRPRPPPVADKVCTCEVSDTTLLPSYLYCLPSAVKITPLPSAEKLMV